MTVNEDVLAIAREAVAAADEIFGETEYTPQAGALNDQLTEAAKEAVERCLTVALESGECVAVGRLEDASVLSTYMWNTLASFDRVTLIYFGYYAMIALAGEWASANGRDDLIDSRTDEIDLLNKIYFENESDA